MNTENRGATEDLVGRIAKWVAIPSAIVALIAAIYALPLDNEIKRLQADAAKMDIAIKKNEADQKAADSARKLTLELYQEVRKVIQAEKMNPREEEAVRVLVESIADDPFRAKLLNALAVGAQSPEVKRKAESSAVFYSEGTWDIASPYAGGTTYDTGTTQVTAASPFGAFNIDFFYCENTQSSSKVLAEKAVALRDAASKGRWRIRLLPETVNSQPGYNVRGNIVRYNPDEKTVAQALIKVLKDKLQLSVAGMEIAYPTPNYVSVFFCAE